MQRTIDWSYIRNSGVQLGLSGGQNRIMKRGSAYTAWEKGKFDGENMRQGWWMMGRGGLTVKAGSSGGVWLS